jgi:hypothetical protein
VQLVGEDFLKTSSNDSGCALAAEQNKIHGRQSVKRVGLMEHRGVITRMDEHSPSLEAGAAGLRIAQLVRMARVPIH